MFKMVSTDTTLFDYATNTRLILRADVLTPGYMPPKPIGRIDQICEVAGLIEHLFQRGSPNNALVFGPPGSGKTMITNYVLRSLYAKIAEMIAERDNLLKLDELDNLSEDDAMKLSELQIQIPTSNVKWCYVLCKKYNTSAGILHKLIFDIDPHTAIKRSGIPLDTYYDELYRLMKLKNTSLIIILDEIDYLSSDDILYNFTRATANIEIAGQFISVWGLSNSVKYEKTLDERVISSAGFEKLHFPSYGTNEIYHILKDRVDYALSPDAIDEDTLLKCASNAAQNGGDVRKALTVLKTAAETANKLKMNKISFDVLRSAEDKVMANEVMAAVLKLQRKHQLVLLAIMKLLSYRKSATTGQVAKVFNFLIDKHNELNPDSILENRDRYFTKRALKVLETLDIITTEMISQGRGRGRTTYVYVDELDVAPILSSIYSDYVLCDLEGYDPIENNQAILFDENRGKAKPVKT
jgi:archaeal cell division control protein 6